MEEHNKNTEAVLRELEEIASRPELFSRTDPYTAPSGYFEQLPENILTNIQSALPAENISSGNAYKDGEEMPSGALPFLFSRTMLRYGIAASTIGILFLVGWWYFLSPRFEKNRHTASQDKELIQNMQPIPETEISDYLETVAAPVLYSSNTSLTDNRDEDIRLMLADLSDWELRNYLEKEDAIN